MTANHENIEMVVRAAGSLGNLCQEVAFLGGATTALLLTDPAAESIRPTLDVDVIVEAASRSDYYALEEQLRDLGFRNDQSEDAPICRWLLDDLILDVMPTAGDILGFSNRWYGEALHHAVPYEIAPAIIINLVTAPYFIATKIEAFHGRGKGDYLASHDLEDIIAVVDGRVELVDEVMLSPEPIRIFIAQKVSNLLNLRSFRDALPGHLPPDTASQQRLPLVLKCLHLLAKAGE